MSKMGLKEIYQMHQHLIMATQHKATILGHMPITNNLESIPNHNNIPNTIIPKFNKIPKIPFILLIHKTLTILD